MGEPPSPCTGVCRLDDAGTCSGCGRRIDEIIEWPAAAAPRKREIVAAARERLSIIRRHLPNDPEPS